MVTVPELVEEEIKNAPFLEEGLSLGLINLSSLARRLQPKIQEKLLKDIQIGAIVMALKRFENNIKINKPKKVASAVLGNITVRSNLIEYTYANSSTLFDKQRELLFDVDKDKSALLAFTHGLFETTLIISSTFAKETEKIFSSEALRCKIDHLSSITLLLSKESINQPGVYYAILKALAWEGINIIEIFSSFTELTIVLENKGVDRAFSTLKKLS